MVLSVHFNSIEIYKYISDDLKLVWGLRVHICTNNVDVFSDFDQIEVNFLIRYHKYIIYPCQALHD